MVLDTSEACPQQPLLLLVFLPHRAKIPEVRQQRLKRPDKSGDLHLTFYGAEGVVWPENNLSQVATPARIAKDSLPTNLLMAYSFLKALRVSTQFGLYHHPVSWG